jgi:hypothetical protein
MDKTARDLTAVVFECGDEAGAQPGALPFRMDREHSEINAVASQFNVAAAGDTGLIPGDPRTEGKRVISVRKGMSYSISEGSSWTHLKFCIMLLFCIAPSLKLCCLPQI